MVPMNFHFRGQKICEIAHEPSGSLIETDAPTDNGGKGSRFSPTDLVGAALGSCILTTMEILAEREKRALDLRGARARVEKEMSGPPRRISRLKVTLQMPAGIPVADRDFLKQIAETCPVARSLHPELKVETQIQYPD